MGYVAPHLNVLNAFRSSSGSYCCHQFVKKRKSWQSRFEGLIGFVQRFKNQGAFGPINRSSLRGCTKWKVFIDRGGWARILLAKNKKKIVSGQVIILGKGNGRVLTMQITSLSTDQAYGFSSGHVWMWELDCEESWAPKNWCFWTVVLEKTLESPLDCKEIQPVHPEGDKSWVLIGRTDAEAETPILLATSCEELTH